MVLREDHRDRLETQRAPLGIADTAVFRKRGSDGNQSIMVNVLLSRAGYGTQVIIAPDRENTRMQ